MNARKFARQTTNQFCRNPQYNQSHCYENDNGRSLPSEWRRRYCVIINVSGRRFRTEEGILERYPGIQLRKHFSQTRGLAVPHIYFTHRMHITL